jgi:hypothetical protein
MRASSSRRHGRRTLLGEDMVISVGRSEKWSVGSRLPRCRQVTLQRQQQRNLVARFLAGVANVHKPTNERKGQETSVFVKNRSVGCRKRGARRRETEKAKLYRDEHITVEYVLLYTTRSHPGERGQEHYKKGASRDARARRVRAVWSGQSNLIEAGGYGDTRGGVGERDRQTGREKERGWRES